jgi:hypothetical protein
VVKSSMSVKRVPFGRLAPLLLCAVSCGLLNFPRLMNAQMPSQAKPQSAPRSRNHAVTPESVPRTSLKPKLQAGDVMRYRIELQTTSQTTHTGAVLDPQGPSELVVTWDAIVRLEVINALDAADTSTLGHAPISGTAQGAPPTRGAVTTPQQPSAISGGVAPVRIRTTYEKSSATIQSDTPDPAAAGIEKQYAQLEGRSIEFTLGSDGHISDIRGLEDIVAGENARSAAEQWMKQLSGNASAPAAGIMPGESWGSQEAANSIPLAGLIWRTDSTYLRNEPCQAANPAGNVMFPGGESCALILSRLALVSGHSSRDATPEEYRHKGLHTKGTWTGEGESLSYISLKSGWVVSVTQTGTEQMDVSISNQAGFLVRYAGTVRTRAELSLLPAVAPAPTPSATSQTPAQPTAPLQ